MGKQRGRKRGADLPAVQERQPLTYQQIAWEFQEGLYRAGKSATPWPGPSDRTWPSLDGLRVDLERTLREFVSGVRTLTVSLRGFPTIRSQSAGEMLRHKYLVALEVSTIAGDCLVYPLCAEDDMRCLVDKAVRPSSLLRDAIKVAAEGLLIARFADTRVEPFAPGYFLPKPVLRQVREALQLLSVDRDGGNAVPSRKHARVSALAKQRAVGRVVAAAPAAKQPLGDNIKVIVRALCRVPEHEGRTAKELSADVKTLTGVEIDPENVRQIIRRNRTETCIEHKSQVGYYIPIARRPAWALASNSQPVT